MLWYVLAVVGALFMLTLILPVTRRMWAFTLFAWKYIGLWLLDVTRLRLVWFKLTGKGDKYRRLGRPLLLR